MRITIEEATPLDQSVQWKLHDAYWAQRGVAAWKSGEIPHLSTSNYPTARQHARFFTALVADLGDRGALSEDEDVWLLECGCGNGRFAANFLRALEADAPALLARTRYVMTDYSEKNLGEVVALPLPAHWISRGHLIPAIYDMHDPQRVRLRDGGALTHGLAMVLSSYVSCALPMKHLQRHADGTWHQLLAEVRADTEDDGPSTAEAYLEALTHDATRYNLLKNLEVHFSWGAVDVDGLLDEPVHADILRATVDGFDEATVGYPFAFVDFLRDVQPLLLPGGAVMTNDYGSVSRGRLEGRVERRPQMYGNSFAQDINFSVFDHVAATFGWELLRTTSELDTLHSAIVSASGFGPRARALFEHDYLSRRPSDNLLDYTAVARMLTQRKEPARALRFYLRCVELDTDDPELRYRAGECALESGHYDVAIEHLERGYALDVERGWDFDFQLGRANSLSGHHDDALMWYQRSLDREEHPVTLTNMGVLHAHYGRHAEAYRAFKRAAELDPHYDRARDRMERLKEAIWEERVKGFDATPTGA